MFKRELIEELKAHDYSPRAWFHYVGGHFHLVRQVIEGRPAPVRSLIGHAAGLFVLLLVFALILAMLDQPGVGRHVFLAGALALLGFSGWALLHLGLLTDLGGRPLLGFGAPNALTLFRGVAGPPLIVLAAAGEIGLAAGVYLLASLSDVVDGYVARRQGPVSRLGVVMDVLVDIVWNTSAIVAFMLAGILPLWILALVAVRYGLLLTGSATFYLLNTEIHIRPTRFGKLTGFFTAGVILLILVNRQAVAHGFIRPGAAGEVESLLEIVLGFLFASTIIHVIVLGLFNIRGSRRQAERVAGKVVGRIRS